MSRDSSKDRPSDETLSVLAWPKSKNQDSNPYNHILYSAIETFAQVDEFQSRKMSWQNQRIFHVHWPDMLLRTRRKWRMKWRFSRFEKMVKEFKANGGKLVWTVHNLKPHNATHYELADKLMAKFVDWVDGFIFMSEASRQQFFELYPRYQSKGCCIIPHLHYRGYYPPAIGAVSRQALDIPENATVLLMFGKLREHKGLHQLFTAHLDNKLPANIFMVVAGEPNDLSESQVLLEKVRNHSNVRLQLSYIPEREVIDYFSMADTVILPYVKILNSGTAILALSEGVPFIAPAMGSLNTLANQFGKDWVFLYKDQLTTDSYREACEWVIENKARRKNRSGPNMDFMSPGIVAQQTVEFYRRLLE